MGKNKHLEAHFSLSQYGKGENLFATLWQHLFGTKLSNSIQKSSLKMGWCQSVRKETFDCVT